MDCFHFSQFFLARLASKSCTLYTVVDSDKKRITFTIHKCRVVNSYNFTSKSDQHSLQNTKSRVQLRDSKDSAEIECNWTKIWSYQDYLVHLISGNTFKVVQYSFFRTIPNFLNWQLKSLSTHGWMWNLHQIFVLDWSLL